MRKHVMASALFLVAATEPLAAKAVSISPGDLPATLQTCLTNGTCNIALTSFSDAPTSSVFWMTEPAGNNGAPDWLIRYTLVPPSGARALDNSIQTPYAGHLWMRGKSVYNASAVEHAVTLYLDKISPTPAVVAPQSGDLALGVTTADLLAGGAYRSMNYVDDYTLLDEGTLTGEIPYVCLAATCQSEVRLSFAHLRFVQGATGVMARFAPLDSRALVFSQRIEYQGDGQLQTFAISAIPEPSHAVLFALGVAAIGLRTRRLTTSAHG